MTVNHHLQAGKHQDGEILLPAIVVKLFFICCPLDVMSAVDFAIREERMEKKDLCQCQLEFSCTNFPHISIYQSNWQNIICLLVHSILCNQQIMHCISRAFVERISTKLDSHAFEITRKMIDDLGRHTKRTFSATLSN